MAWEAFREANGARSAQEMRARIARYRRADPADRSDFEIGCRILTQPFFFAEADWIPVPVNRVSPSAKPQAPISSGATLASVGLNDDTALNLATECPWLDGVSFRRSDFAEGIARRTEREKAQEFVVKDGWDALGGDFMNMPMRNVSFEDCQTQCNRNDRCMALTYNKKFRACFLKGSATVLVRNIDAATAARRVVETGLQYSSLVFATNTVVVGHSYSNTEMGYADCISACSTAEACVGFNFDSKNRMCALMDNVVSSSKFTGVESGLKATAN